MQRDAFNVSSHKEVTESNYNRSMLTAPLKMSNTKGALYIN